MECNTRIPLPMGQSEKGWICPVCGTGMASRVESCPCVINREQESLKRGLEQLKSDKRIDRGDFSQYIDEEETCK